MLGDHALNASTDDASTTTQTLSLMPLALLAGRSAAQEGDREGSAAPAAPQAAQCLQAPPMTSASRTMSKPALTKPSQFELLACCYRQACRRGRNQRTTCSICSNTVSLFLQSITSLVSSHKPSQLKLVLCCCRQGCGQGRRQRRICSNSSSTNGLVPAPSYMPSHSSDLCSHLSPSSLHAAAGRRAAEGGDRGQSAAPAAQAAQAERRCRPPGPRAGVQGGPRRHPEDAALHLLQPA